LAAEIKQFLYKRSLNSFFIDAPKLLSQQVLPLARPGGLIMAHNMNYPAPDLKYIEAITTNPDLETIFLLMEGTGMGMTLKKR
jgi:caffeoyl-CoA O-methyltransferase